MTRVLLTGASGFIGQRLGAALDALGVDVVRASRAATPQGPGWVHFDANRPETFAPALTGCEVAVWLVHAMAEGEDYEAREIAQAEAFSAAAHAAGVARIVYVGGLRPTGYISRHFRSRLATGAAFASGRVPVVELRASVVIGPGSEGWVILRDLAARLPAMVVPRWLENRTCPVHVDDLIRALVAAIGVGPGAAPKLTPGVWDVPGPETLRYRDVLTRVAKAMGRRPLMVRVPLLSPTLSALWLGLVTRTRVAVARELAEGLRSDIVATERVVWEVIGPPLVSLDQAIADTLAVDPPPNRKSARIVEWIASRLTRRA